MFKKVILIGILTICFIIFTQGIKAEAGQTLKKDTTIQGITFPRGTEVQFYINGDLLSVKLPRDMNIQGLFCAKAPEFVGFHYGSNRIGHATLAQEQLIEGIPCAKGFIDFYESGKLQSGTLRWDEEIEGRLYKQGDIVKLDEDGKLL